MKLSSRYPGLYNGGFHIHVSDWTKANEHRHDFLEFVFVARGAMNHHINGRIEKIASGEYFFVDHKITHSYEQISDEPLFVINFLFYPEFLDRTLVGKRTFDDILNCFLLKFSYKTLKEPVTGKAFFDKNDIIRDAVQNIMYEYENKNYGYLEWIRCQFVKILITAMRDIGKINDIPEQNALISSITNHVKQHYNEKLKLSDIANELNYSVGYLSAYFSKTTGMQFSEYLQQIRIEHACRLLENTKMSVSEISQAVGINDTKFFYKTFKKHLNCTPNKFRSLL